MLKKFQKLPLQDLFAERDDGAALDPGDLNLRNSEDSGRLLCEMLHDRMKYILLGHLSAENNYPALAYETVCAEVTMGDNPYRACDFAIQVARRDTTEDLLEF